MFPFQKKACQLAATLSILLVISISPQVLSAETNGLPASPSLDPKNIIQRLTLSPAEQTWLAKQPTIRVRVGAAPPLHMFKEGEPQGISVDYARLFCQGFGLHCTFITMPWSEAVENIGAGKDGDLILTIKRTPERESVIAFTSDYLKMPWVIFNREDSPFVGGMADLEGKTLSVERGYVLKGLLEKEHPGIKLIEAKTSKDAIEALATGSVDAYIGNLTISSYLINRWGFSNVKVAAPTSLGSHDQAMGVGKDWPELVTLMDRFLAAMTQGEHASIKNRWLSIKYEYGIDWPFVWKVIGGIAAVSFLIITIIIIWNRRLRAEVARRTELEEQLRLSARFGHIVEQSLNEIYIFDEKKLNFLQVNRGARENLGYTLEELQNITPIDIKPELTPEKFEEYIRPLRDGETNVIIFETVHKRKDGSLYDVEVHLQLMHREMPPVFIAIIQDITERKMADLALQKAKTDAENANKAKSEFLASMSHELRTPLNAMMGLSEMMSLKIFGPLGDPHYEDYAEDIHKSGSHLISLIDDILDLSKVEAGKYVLNEKDLDITPIIDTCVNMISAFADLKKIDLIADIPPDLPLVNVDERAMIQVINNLLSNAVKFTPDGGHITVSAYVMDENSFEISVTDTGIGMSREDITKALKPFEQPDSTHARRHEGTGLGLHLSQNLVKLHGGRLKIESERGQGTTVVVHLPPHRTVLS